MKIAKKRFLSFIILFVALLAQFCLVCGIGAVKVSAADNNLWNMVQEGGLSDVGTEVYGSDAPKDIRVIVARIIQVVLGLLGIIFLVIIITAGYKWMTAAGNEEKVREAKDQLTRGVIGLVIILVAFSITLFVVDEIRKAISGEVW
ncbi:pilin [Patescibacteria group bacterium]|nr:pilin [Patescibacteria group bacterium]MBU4347793.1 pilin [Patescibacteria group bacterium]MBU4455015.1 pilin [Patescibacteria group bacterium]MCG2690973.1 pilin [Candidatus Parcubacteria bacterium]